MTGQNQLDQYNAGQQQTASTLQGVGEAAGIAAMFF
jgi:isopropylmalate/homocitrate/citramalate synthase